MSKLIEAVEALYQGPGAFRHITREEILTLIRAHEVEEGATDEAGENALLFPLLVEAGYQADLLFPECYEKFSWATFSGLLRKRYLCPPTQAKPAVSKGVIEALEYYAAWETHGFIGNDNGFYASDDAPIQQDQGKIARAALTALQEQQANPQCDNGTKG